MMAGIAPDTTSDHQHGDTVQERLPNPAHGVRDPSRRHNHDRADGVGSAAHSISHEGRTHFVGGEDWLYSL